MAESNRRFVQALLTRRSICGCVPAAAVFPAVLSGKVNEVKYVRMANLLHPARPAAVGSPQVQLAPPYAAALPQPDLPFSKYSRP